MAKCDICNKIPTTGNEISIARSHVSNRATRTFSPNVRSVKTVDENGETKRMHVCAKCLRSGKVKRA